MCSGLPIACCAEPLPELYAYKMQTAGLLQLSETLPCTNMADCTFMLKWRSPLPLVRPEGGGSPPELDPLEGRALHPTQNIRFSVML